MNTSLFDRVRHLFIVLGTVAVVFALPTWAQDEDEDAAELGKIEVTGSRLNQLRFSIGDTSLTDKQMAELQYKHDLIKNNESSELSDKLENGFPLSVDLKGVDGVVGYKAKKHSKLIDCDKVKNYKISSFWEKITIDDLIISEENQNRSLEAIYLCAFKLLQVNRKQIKII